ncbi:hypothetical protein NDU88_005005 [Pleurodeles waltl]|uniref:Uncharacterized protein n=1 Tax=Pleurodeles waltl TaxID=8319 RepID=A0AAV7SKG9_PLEWA|nr:hypothetical protein NDU88_005005 [Pleurodeles waltl]
MSAHDNTFLFTFGDTTQKTVLLYVDEQQSRTERTRWRSCRVVCGRARQGCLRDPGLEATGDCDRTPRKGFARAARRGVTTEAAGRQGKKGAGGQKSTGKESERLKSGAFGEAPSEVQGLTRPALLHHNKPHTETQRQCRESEVNQRV